MLVVDKRIAKDVRGQVEELLLAKTRTPGASRGSEPKPIKPINHEQPTNRGFFISTALLITSLAKAR